MSDALRPTGRLRGVRIFLLGGMPEEPQVSDKPSVEYIERLEDEAIAVEEAVVSLARTVFAHGADLLVIDDPLVTPLVSQVAWEYWDLPPAEVTQDSERHPVTPRVTIYHRGLEKHEDPATRISARHGYVALAPIDALPTARPDAIVCIGGTDISDHLGRLRPEESLHERGPLLFTIESTGGAARRVSPDERVEKATLEDLGRARAAMRFEASADRPGESRQDSGEPEEAIPEFPYATYPIIMRRIVERIAERLGRTG